MRKQSGYLMLVIALFLTIIAGLATAFVAMLLSTSNSSASNDAAIKAYNLAKTGIENGSYLLSQGTCTNTLSSTITVAGQGEYQYRCVQNQTSSTITSAMSVSSSSIVVSSSTNFDNFGAIIIDSETIYYNGKSGNTLLNLQRGQNGTSAATHTSGAAVSQSQYMIFSLAGSPSLAAPYGQVQLAQALLAPDSVYYIAGVQGTNGVVIRYTNPTFTTVLSTSNDTYRGIDVGTNYGMVVGTTGGTTNGVMSYFDGANWSNRTTQANHAYYSVTCDFPNNSTQCWMAGQFTLTFLGIPLGVSPELTFNKAGTLTTYTSNGTTNPDGVSCNNGSCAAVFPSNAYNFSLTSTAPFNTRQAVCAGTSVDCASNSLCVLSCSNGQVGLYTNNAWVLYSLTPTRVLNDVHCPTTNNCVIVGNGGTIWNCNIGATSCVLQTAPGTINLNGVYCNSTNDCLAVGAGNQVYRYTSGSWIAVPLTGTNYTLYDVSGTGTANSLIPTVLEFI